LKRLINTNTIDLSGAAWVERGNGTTVWLNGKEAMWSFHWLKEEATGKDEKMRVDSATGITFR
jgi:hypothetical protein